MTRVNVFDVKARLSEYLDRAARGERIVVCRHNKPVAELRALAEVRSEPRPVGPLPGRPRFDVPPSFFEPLPVRDVDAWEAVTSADPLSERSAPPPRGRVPRVTDLRGEYAKRPRRRTTPRRS